MIPRTRPRMVTGIVLVVLVLALGALALTHMVTNADLHGDVDISHLRDGTLTPVAEGLNNAASQAVGIAGLVIALLALVVLRRRWDALRALCVAGAAWVVAEIIKKLLDRPRPPSWLWVIKPDPTGSFPSGTTTTGIVLFLLAVILAWRAAALRKLVIVVGLAFAICVGLSRLYLGDHYPTDVLGSFLTVTATTILVSAITDLRWFRGLAARVLRAPEAAPPALPPGAHSLYSRSPQYSARHTGAFDAPDASGEWQPDATTEAWPQEPARDSWQPDATTQALRRNPRPGSRQGDDPRFRGPGPGSRQGDDPRYRGPGPGPRHGDDPRYRGSGRRP